MENIQAFKTLIGSPKKVVVVTHFKPDADALGSSLGLAGFLRKKGHTVTVITPSDYPGFLTWMSGNNEVLALTKEIHESGKRAQALIDGADIIFCLDFSNLKRIDSLEGAVRASRATKVLVDHHLEPEQFASFVQWDVQAASTAGLVFQLIKQLGEQHLIDASIALVAC